MLSDEEKEAIEQLRSWREYIIKHKEDVNKANDIEFYLRTMINLIEKQSKEIEELKETLKCTQNSWFEDTQKIEEMKKQIDLDNECEIALNNRIMDLEKTDKKCKDKIKAKIEELDKAYEDSKNKDGESFYYYPDYTIRVLQSLLEKE